MEDTDDKLVFLKAQNEMLLEKNESLKNDLLDIANVIESDDILRSQLDEYQKTISTITIALQDHLP